MRVGPSTGGAIISSYGSSEPAPLAMATGGLDSTEAASLLSDRTEAPPSVSIGARPPGPCELGQDAGRPAQW
jgi:hypothetical protein